MIFAIRATAALAIAALSIAAAPAQTVTDPLAALSGRWVWVGNSEKYGHAKACAERWERYEVSADRRTIQNWYIADNNGKPEQKTGKGYVVLYEEGNSFALYLNNEERRLKNGDRYVWMGIFETRDRLHWRVHGSSATFEQLAPYARLRCPDR